MKVFLLLTILGVTACSNVDMPRDQNSAIDEAEKAKLCQELREEIDDLEGKPARRGAHLEYYQSTCIESNY